MKPSPNASDAAVIRAFAGIPGLLEQTPALIARGRALDCECLLGPIDHPFHVSIRAGRIVELTPAPVLMRSCRFCTPDDTRRTAAAIGGASVTIMEQLGHFPMSESPERFRRYIAPVLNEILKQSTTPTKQGVHV